MLMTINVVRVYAKPDVGLTTSLPAIAPDFVIPNGATLSLILLLMVNPDEAVWAGAYTFDLGWDIQTLRTRLSRCWQNI